MGSTLAARRAGNQQAPSDTAVSSAVTASQVAASVGVTPKSRCAKALPATPQIPSPTASPSAVSSNPSLTINRAACPGDAPNAVRIPNSRVRFPV